MKIKLTFTKPGYIAQPYWPELYELVEIKKKSGMQRARSDKKIRESLETYLKKINMTLVEFHELEKKAARPFFTNGSGHIFIPSDRLQACLANANDVAPANIRINNMRTSLRASDFQTAKKEPDGVWKRFVVPRDGKGNVLSNQRGLREDSYIENFDATGVIDHDESMVRPEAVMELLQYAGREVGIGAARNMGWGRFVVSVS